MLHLAGRALLKEIDICEWVEPAMGSFEKGKLKEIAPTSLLSMYRANQTAGEDSGLSTFAPDSLAMMQTDGEREAW